MDIQVYENILSGLEVYNDTKSNENFGNTILSMPPLNPSYPITILQEIRNVANSSYNTCFDRVSSVGYRVDVYAKNKKNVTGQTIARQIAKLVDEYLTNYVGLTRVSFNVVELVNSGSIYHIIMTYSGNLLENRKKII